MRGMGVGGRGERCVAPPTLLFCISSVFVVLWHIRLRDSFALFYFSIIIIIIKGNVSTGEGDN